MTRAALVESADLVVIGGGPAGLGAAIAAAEAGRAVTVVEPRTGIIDKACGEGLMPGALGILDALGVREVPGVDFRGIRYRDARDPVRCADGDFPRASSGRGVRRMALHAALLDRARALGVRWIEDRVERIEPGADRVRIGGGRWTADARYVIAADGLHSPTRRMLGLDRPLEVRRPRYGMRRHFRRAPWIDRVEVHWAADAEAYITPVAHDTVGVAFLFHKPARYDDLLQRFPLLAEQLIEAEPVSTARGAGPFRQRARDVVCGRVLLVGDAAGYVDPLTGEGVAVGLATARAAVAAIVAERPASYRRAWRRATRRYFMLTAGLLGIAQIRPLRRLIIPVTRRVPLAFDTALRLLAGHGPALPAPAAQLETG